MGIFHTIDVMLSLSVEVGWGAGIFLSRFPEFESSLGQEFKLFWEFGVHNFRGSAVVLGDWLRISHQVVRKIVLYIVCFAYSLLSL